MRRRRNETRTHLSENQIERSDQRNDICKHVVPDPSGTKDDQSEDEGIEYRRQRGERERLTET